MARLIYWTALTLAVFLGCSALVFCAGASEPPGRAVRWNPISGTSEVKSEGAGDPESSDGATLLIDSIGVTVEQPGGVITALDPSIYRGQELELSANIETIEGSGSAAVWVRADSKSGQRAFATSARSRVSEEAPQSRSIRLFVPTDSSNLVLGAIAQGEAKVRISRFRVSVVTATQPEVSAYDVLEAAFSFVEERALKASVINLAAHRELALKQALHSAPPSAAYSMIADLLAALGDKHSFALTPSEATLFRNTGRSTSSVEFKLIGSVGYISVPGFKGTGTEASNRFKNAICSALRVLAPDASTGWVVDLRQNTGGNMRPMLGGLIPLLGEGNYGSFRDRDGHDRHWATLVQKDCSVPIDSRARIAVLVGARTASSGEAVAVAFSGRPNSRSFGVATAGLSTSNLTLDLPDGGALLLTNAIDVDRTGKEFPNGLTPDVMIENDGTEDDTLTAALWWLENPSALARP